MVWTPYQSGGSWTPYDDLDNFTSYAGGGAAYASTASRNKKLGVNNILKNSPGYKAGAANNRGTSPVNTRSSPSNLGTGAASNRNLRMGMYGGDVRNLQSMLRNAGYDIKVDGQFGQNTDRAVRDYQRKMGLKVDGIAGTDTRGKLMSGAGKSTKSGNTYSSPSSPSKPSNTSVPGGPGGPGGISGIGGSGSSGDSGATVGIYKPRGEDALKSEITQATDSIFNPILQALAQRQAEYEKALRLGRVDIAAQYAQQIADLKVLAERTAGIINANKESVNTGYETAKTTSAANTAQARETSGNLYDSMQDRFANEIQTLGLNGLVPTEGSAILRDKSFADALLANTGQMETSGLNLGQGAASTALGMLASNSAAQSESLQGQSRIARDEALREIEREFLDRLIEGRTEIGQTESNKQNWAYENMRSLIDSEWAKYMDSAQLNWTQQSDLMNYDLNQAKLWADLQASQAASGDSKVRMNQWQYADQTLRESISGLPPDQQQEVMYIWGLLSDPYSSNNTLEWNGAKIGPSNYAGLRYGEGDSTVIPGYSIRANRSIASRDWGNNAAQVQALLSNAISNALLTNKTY